MPNNHNKMHFASGVLMLPWAADCPQVPLGIGMAIDCVFDELGIPETSENWYRMEHDHAWRVTIQAIQRPG